MNLRRTKPSGARLSQPQHGTGWRASNETETAAAGTAARRGFTLVELIAVMALLVTVIAIAAPSLAGFFRGRAIDAEARRLLSLTRQGQSRAAAEALPMILWVDLNQRTYGLETDSSFVDEDSKAVQYTLDGNVTLEVGATTEALPTAITGNTLFENDSAAGNSKHASLPNIRFEPDGSISEGNRENLRLTDRDGGSLWVGLAANRMNYEIRNQEAQRTTARRR